jgi:hypothetical protein
MMPATTRPVFADRADLYPQSHQVRITRVAYARLLSEAQTRGISVCRLMSHLLTVAGEEQMVGAILDDGWEEAE